MYNIKLDYKGADYVASYKADYFDLIYDRLKDKNAQNIYLDVLANGKKLLLINVIDDLKTIEVVEEVKEEVKEEPKDG